MSNRRSLLALCCGILGFGFVMGLTAGAFRFGSPAEANSLDPDVAERLYGELRSANSPLQVISDHQSKIAKVCSPSVVHIQSERYVGGRRGMVEETGSGVIVSNKKFPGFYVVTNRHVVDGTELKNVSIHLSDGRILSPAKIWSDKSSDLAIMRLSETDLHPARWGDSRKLEIGHIVYAMGSPFGLSQSMTQGIISAKGRRALELGPNTDVINQDFLQTDAAINPGNSGGPLINLQGEVIGINTAIASNSGGNEGIGFSIPSNLVLQVIDQLLEYGKVNRAYLGVKLDPDFDLATARRLKLDRLRGARVMQVYDDTPASRAKLLFDDVVLYFDGVEVLDENHLIHLVSLQPLNKDITAIVMRAGTKVSVTVKLSERPDTRQSLNDTTKPGSGIFVDKLGLTLNSITTKEARELGFPKTTSGLLIVSVDRQSPLAGKVQIYDLIEEVARTPIHTIDDLQDLLDSRETLTSLTLKVQRTVKGRVQSQLVTVGGK